MSAAVDHITFRDALDHLVDYTRANPSEMNQRLGRQAVLSAMREIGHNHQWSYYYQQGRINTVASFTAGTIDYVHTGGSYERLVTLTPDGSGATFPTWATFGHLRIGTVVYTVAEWRSGTQLQLTIASNPGADLAAGQSFELFRDCYLLPVDFVRTDRMYAQDIASWIEFVKPDDWLRRRDYYEGSATPRFFTVKGSTDYQGCMEACFFPAPDQAETIDFIYQRRPRKVAIENYEVGKVSVSSGTKTVTGDGTAFEEAMVGAIIRFGDDKRDVPTSKTGDNVYEYERMVMQVNNATELIVDQNLPVSLTDVRYVISDVIDIEAGAMGTLFLRCLESQFAKIARLSDREEIEAEYQRQLIQAREADSRSFEPRSVGGYSWPRTLSDHQYGHGVDIA